MINFFWNAIKIWRVEFIERIQEDVEILRAIFQTDSLSQLLYIMFNDTT